VVDATSVPAITVAFTPVKGDRPEWVVQKLTELGVDRIVALRAERSVVRWEGERADRQVERWVKVAREAAMQCRRTRLPAIEGVVEADLVLASPGTAVAHPGGDGPDLAWPTLAIGPEGGWTARELGLGAHQVGLGPTVLRAETAALTAAALLAALRAGLTTSTRNVR
jgi:16S rRNA (uracil1498-N3)-methyltransferase